MIKRRQHNKDNIVCVLNFFCLSLGLKLNINKSIFYGVGMEGGKIDMMAGLVGCVVGILLFKYLGLRIGSSMFYKSIGIRWWINLTINFIFERLGYFQL